MKTIFNIQNGMVTLLCTAVFAGLTACDAGTVEREGGKLPDREPLETTYGMLRSSNAAGNTVRIKMTEGAGFVTSNFYYQLSQAPDTELSLETTIDGSMLDEWNEANDEQRILLPETNYNLLDGSVVSLPAGKQRSDIKRIQFMAENLSPGEYYLPLTVVDEEDREADQTINFLISVRARQLGEYQLNTNQIFAVFYINTGMYQPLLVDEYLMSKLNANTWEYAWDEREDGMRTIGNIINLNTVTLDYDAGSGRALLNLGNDMRYVLDHIDKYIRPLQDKGRKVCICLEGGGSGLGFCNLTDTQIEDFVAQVKAVITAYELDGVNFWDRNAGYGKEGMPAMNTTSYPKLIKAMREALGNDKLVTLTDFEEPTEYFWDTAATGGIEVGQYLDYAWSGYLNNEKEIQIVDPWHQGEQYVSTDYPRKPIAGLDPSKYGCVNIPWYASEEKTPMDYLVGIFHWRNAGNKQSNILVYEDLRTVLQDNLESTWTDSFKYGYTFFADDGTWLIEESKWGLSILSDNEYEFNPFFLAQVDGGSGYNKWLKDW
ncbi:MAG TPA: DUF1735 domain-containing protein [Candidatus Alistipes avistercoris]|uniref:BT_3987 domain-containing protein n=1 Tax=uncultured Alistipes sp. TaxID=538949 RepID=UPI001FA26B46|nr:DUF1735 domain-containing protein [uncultured Alistipes sp.]HIX97110.1 DUF1735 domain-containing protein [Candidatus Alistipes avistercoris]